MHASVKYERQLSLYSLACKSGQFAPHIHPKEASAVRRRCAGNGRRDIVTCYDDGWEQDLAAVGGLNMMEISIGGSSASLPNSVPIVPKELFGQPDDIIPSGVVGVRLNDILTKGVSTKQTGHRYLPEGSDVDPYILSQPIFKGKQVILFSTGQDVLIETLWWERYEIDLLPTLSGMGFLGITGMNFSVFDGECAFAHALNIMKSLRFCEELNRLGVWVIPHIYAINIYQRQRWADWLIANPGVTIVTINSQLQKSKADLDNLTATVRHLLKHTSVEIILQGANQNLMRGLNSGEAVRVRSATSTELKSALIHRRKSSVEYTSALIEGIILSDVSIALP
jgi:hypothetical protein